MKRLMVLGAFWSLWGFVGLAEVRVAPLAEMRDALSVPSYDAADRALLCRQSLMVMEELFVHRELKVKDFGVQHDPVPRLQALCQSSDRMDNKKFHRTVSDIFIDLHDLHTNYSGARPLSCGVAFIPVKFGDASTASGEHQILVARKLNTGAEHVAGIQAGMRLMAVDGEDVERVIERLGHASGGANASAMRHRAIQMLTMRGAATYPLPEADATELEVMDANGVRSKHLVPWLVQASTECLNQDDFRSLRPMIPVARAMNMGVDRFQREYNQIFGQDQVRTTRERSQPVRNLVVIDRYQDRFNRLHNLTNTPPPRGNERSEAIASVFEHAVIRTPAGHLGYIKLKSFYWESESLDVGTVTEAFRRTLEESFAGTVGLVVDVRGNPGGFIIFAEKLIQLFAPRGVEPTTVRMLANELNHEIFIAANGSDNRWSAALRQAMSRREKYMEPMAITPEAEANSIGQVWFKPVVVLTDAACYSACDLFSAGMQDNGAGVILGLHEHTGAGGANVMEYGTFRQILAGSSVNPFVELPFGHDIRVSWRQAIRAGKNAGALLENRGII
jgi:C-terminal processing protease CtpA/Prc